MTARKMVRLNIEETSGVDHPAHLDEGWILMKNADLTNEDFDTIEKMVALEADLAKAQERIAELESQVAVSGPEDEDGGEDEDEIVKSAPAPVREAILKARRETAEAQEELRKEREIRLDAEAIVKSEERFPNLSVDHDEFGPAMRRLEELSADLYEVVTKALDSANGQAEAAAIFAEIGSSHTPTASSAYQKIEVLAKAAVAKGDHKTVEQAISSLIAENPALYAEYISETR